ncbi:dienelactone hydrolase family protein [Paenibacillus silviterrae]|uniref:dienelactone hydrolase family protein n=1 Tax=Paenibacillus silviterrae TaxID=3242194 RepID=UPI002542793A|nr:dienelactone hydrolase family protein [Paenibacillus chinjuensis]
MDRMWHPDEFLKKLYAEQEQERKRLLDEPWDKRRTRLRAKLGELLGEFKVSGELAPKLLERVELPEHGLVRERVEYTTAEGLRVPAYVVLPQATEGKRLPAVLAWHGHGYGSRESVGLLTDGSVREGAPGIHNDFALELAKRGVVVLLPEIVGFGDRKLQQDLAQDPGIGNSCFSIGAALLLAGKTIAGLRVYEARRAVDYLAARPEVDAERIGGMGFSGGGMVASLHGAVDDRVKATVLCGYPNTYESSILARRHCLDNYIPGVLPYAEMPDLLALLAPRPLFIESGDEDHLFPAETVKEVISKLRSLYTQLEAGERFAFDIFEGKHEIKGRYSYDWLTTVLRSTDGSIH